MRKRERENPCGVCGHYHKYEEGEVCGVCGHRPLSPSDRPTPQSSGSAFPSEILKDFLYLGSYDNASRCELLKTINITRILNTVPACQNLYKNSFTYHCLQDDKALQFDDAIQFLEQCEKEKACVLVHCMSGRSRSPAIVMAYLMKCKGWRFAQSFQWVKDHRPQVELTPAARQQLQDYEQKIFGSIQAEAWQPVAASGSVQSFGFSFSNTASNPPFPMFNQPSTMSIFERAGASSHDFVFGAARNTDQMMTESYVSPAGSEPPMDGA